MNRSIADEDRQLSLTLKRPTASGLSYLTFTGIFVIHIPYFDDWIDMTQLHTQPTWCNGESIHQCVWYCQFQFIMNGFLPINYISRLKMKHERQRSVVGNGPKMCSYTGLQTSSPGPLSFGFADITTCSLELNPPCHTRYPAFIMAAPTRPRRLSLSLKFSQQPKTRILSCGGQDANSQKRNIQIWYTME